MRKGEVFYETKYKYLFHLTDNHGFAFTIDQNALRPLRQNYVSTTYDPEKNSVYGYQGYDFKFVLDAKKLVSQYGGFVYDHHIRQGNKRVSLNEREIGIDTLEIAPFTDYLYGAILLFDIFSETSIRWLLYDNIKHKSFFSIEKSVAPRAIEAVFTLMKRGIPIWTKSIGNELSNLEKQFLRDLLRIHRKGSDFQSALRSLVEKYPIVDYNKTVLNKLQVIRRQITPKISAIYNEYYVGRKYKDIDRRTVRSLFRKGLDMLRVDPNTKEQLLAAIQQRGLFHPVIAPVDWGIIFNHIVDGDNMAELFSALDWMKENSSRKMRDFDNATTTDLFYRYGSHLGTRF